ncbi:MAG: hypothetical protein LBD50_03115 [Rickettsiales bacterium]|nr:hypothetical protein [Rickettsiales bacterium]
MKKIFIILFAWLAVCVAPLDVRADDADTARAAKRGGTNTAVVSSGRQKADAGSAASSQGASRLSGAAQKTDVVARERTTSPRDGAAAPAEKSRAVRVNQSVAPRQSVGRSNAAQTGQRVSERIPASAARTATTRAAGMAPATSAVRSATDARIKSPSRAAANIARAAGTSASASIAKDYKKCREVFYGCMDEFCANKDAQLKRCACSSKVHDFDSIKNKMSNVEDKILTFNERLLTVSMDKEDAAAISLATEGELAFQKEDKSSSKQILDEIAKKLKTSSADNELSRNLSAISLSLDTDSAFDSIDSMMGSSTAAKEGTALYSAALPVCRDMVKEVCDTDGAAIAESGYQMTIEQDCNTVAKAYETLQGQAVEKVREGSALLDMSRLDIYQKRNSDDILTCKKKMLDMMSDSSVCGTDLGKCLDTTGRYIDPSTGEAFLTVNLVNLGSLITRPSGDQKWTTAPGNNIFVSYLNSKKNYLEPAMENCQDISGQVWDDFIEDALAQIKLAQEKKLEDMRQGCTTLTTQCLEDTADSVSEFDARALSIFGVLADKTVNEMCAGIKTACTSLLQTTGSDADWVGGMTEIATDKTYDSIISTCREVGKACIIQSCKSISGNFGLCESIDKSTNRKSIINRSACWPDVLQCVASTGADNIGRIMERLGKTPTQSSGDFYKELYKDDVCRTNSGSSCPDDEKLVYDICYDCGTAGKPDCGTCRLAERIWGNCEYEPTHPLESSDNPHNKIKVNPSTETLLSWFATNTGTNDPTNYPDSCRSTDCGPGQKMVCGGFCAASDGVSDEGENCTSGSKVIIAGEYKNCCSSTAKDFMGNCCEGGMKNLGFGTDKDYSNISADNKDICATNNTAGDALNFAAKYPEYPYDNNILVCVNTNTVDSYDEDEPNDEFPDGRGVSCGTDGIFVVINKSTGVYSSAAYLYGDASNPPLLYSYYKEGCNNNCIFDPKDNGGKWKKLNSAAKTYEENQSCSRISGAPTANISNPNANNNLLIKFNWDNN